MPWFVTHPYFQNKLALYPGLLELLVRSARVKRLLISQGVLLQKSILFPSSVPGGRGTGRRTTVTPVYPSIPDRSKPVTQLPPPRSKTIHDVHIYEPHRGG